MSNKDSPKKDQIELVDPLKYDAYARDSTILYDLFDKVNAPVEKVNTLSEYLNRKRERNERRRF